MQYQIPLDRGRYYGKSQPQLLGPRSRSLQVLVLGIRLGLCTVNIDCHQSQPINHEVCQQSEGMPSFSLGDAHIYTGVKARIIRCAIATAMLDEMDSIALWWNKK